MELVEASMNFDASGVRSFLERLVPLVDSGFAEEQVSQISKIVEELDIDGEWEHEFEIVYRGKASRLLVYVYMDDVNSPDIAFFAPPALAAEINREMARFAEEPNH